MKKKKWKKIQLSNIGGGNKRCVFIAFVHSTKIIIIIIMRNNNEMKWTTKTIMMIMMIIKSINI